MSTINQMKSLPIQPINGFPEEWLLSYKHHVSSAAVIPFLGCEEGRY